MFSVNGKAVERPYRPESEVTAWRWRLLALYRAEKRYQHVTGIDLRKLWRSVDGLISPATVTVRWNPSNADPPVWETLTPKAPSACASSYSGLQLWATEERERYKKPGLRDYVEAVESFVVNTMQLRDRTDPTRAAWWACEYVHRDVEPLAGVSGTKPNRTPYDPDAVRQPVAPYISRHIALEVSLGHGVVVSGDEATEAVERYLYPPLGAHGGFNDWDDLERLAKSVVESEIASMRDQMREQHLHRRLATHHNHNRDLQDLFAYLFLRVPRPHVGTIEGKASDQRLRELSRLLEMAYPVA